MTTLTTAFKNATNTDNFNDAIFQIQSAIGQDDGGIAGIFFSDYEQDDNGDIIAWKLGNRAKILLDYIAFELTYLQS